MNKSEKVLVTTNYKLFTQDRENRDLSLDSPPHKKLLASMKAHGFLKCFPLAVVPDGTGLMKIIDGQHRKVFAEMLGLPIYYTIIEPFDVAEIQGTVEDWTEINYVKRFINGGNTEYAQAMQFAQEHGLTIGSALALLNGKTAYTQVKRHVEKGTYKITDRNYAERVVFTYSAMVKLSESHFKGKRFLDACMAICRVQGFESHRLISGAERCRHMFEKYSNRDSYLALIEKMYNYGRQNQVPLKNEALLAMKARNPCHKKGEAKGVVLPPMLAVSVATENHATLTNGIIPGLG